MVMLKCRVCGKVTGHNITGTKRYRCAMCLNVRQSRLHKSQWDKPAERKPRHWVYGKYKKK